MCNINRQIIEECLQVVFFSILKCNFPTVFNFRLFLKESSIILQLQNIFDFLIRKIYFIYKLLIIY